MADISSSFLGHIEKGTRVPSLKTIFHLSRVLGISVDELIANDANNNETKDAWKKQKQDVYRCLLEALEAMEKE